MFKLGFHAVSGSKFRSVLTILGIVMGIATMITVLCVGSAGELEVENELKNFGIDRILIYPSDIYSSNSLTIEDKEILDENIEGCLITASGFLRMNISYGSNSVSAEVSGTTPELQHMDNKSMIEGRFINEADYEYARKCIVLSQEVAQELFGSSNAIDNKVEIDGVKYNVIGIEENKNQLVSAFVSTKCYIPITTFNSNFSIGNISEIAISVENDRDISYVEALSTSLLLERHGQGSIKIVNLEEQMENASDIISIFTLVVSAVALVSLLVGGVGIMNMMLVTVKERKKEIGLAKAIGATNGQIMLQFLSESVIYCAVGAVLGILFGSIFTYAAGEIINIDAKVTPISLVISVGFSVLVGGIFGIFPALRAASLDPVVALRS